MIAGNKSKISCDQLKQFLKVEGCFEAKLTDLYAIMRRCDHNADGMLDGNEFRELCDEP